MVVEESVAVAVRQAFSVLTGVYHYTLGQMIICIQHLGPSEVPFNRVVTTGPHPMHFRHLRIVGSIKPVRMKTNTPATTTEITVSPPP